MAVIAQDPNKTNRAAPTDQGQSQNQASSPAPNPGVNVSGGSAQNEAAPGGARAQSQNAATPGATSSGRFTNLNNYLNANKSYNADNGGLAGQVGQGLANQGNAIQQNVQNSQNQFNTDANAGRVQYNQSLVNNAINDPWAYANNQVPHAVSADGSPPVDYTKQFTQQRDAKYTGPQAIDQDHSLRNQASDYQNLANNSQNENGRFSLLRSMFNTPQYSAGQQKLDNVFLQADPNQQLQSAAANANKMVSGINQQVGQTANDVQTYQNEAQATHDATIAALNKAITGFGDENTMVADPNDPNKQIKGYVNQKMADEQAAQLAKYQAAAGLAGRGLVSHADASAFGLSPDSHLYGLNLADYLSQNTDPLQNGQATRTNVLSNDDYNRINGLGMLAGNTVQGDAQKYLDEYKPGTDGTYADAGKYAAANPYSFDTARFNQARDAAEANYNRAPGEIADQEREALDAINGEMYAHGGLHTALEAYNNGTGGNSIIHNPQFNEQYAINNLTNGDAQNQARAMGYGNWLNSQNSKEYEKLNAARARQAGLQALFDRHVGYSDDVGVPKGEMNNGGITQKKVV